MAFIRNAWYCVGYPDEIGADKIKSLKVFGEPLMLYRTPDGAARALVDRCPHRFAPLSRGRIIDGQVQCPYHGLKFDGAGRCTHNPHGDHAIPKAAQVRSYPVLERHGVLWVWMGDAEQADPAALPDFSVLEERPGWARAQGYLKSPAGYELIIDNLLDLTHTRYLHPFLAGIESERATPDGVELRLEQQDDSVLSIYEIYGDTASPFTRMMWDGADGAPPDRIDSRQNMRWYAPSLLLLDSGYATRGGPLDSGPSFPSAHLLTPETETTTHYFFIVTRDTHVNVPQVSEQLIAAGLAAFSGEDSPMIEACQANMNGQDLMALNPVLLQTDAPAIRARRLLAERLAADGRRGGVA